MGRAQSMMLGAGLYLEAIGEIEQGALWAAYESEEKMRPVWDQFEGDVGAENIAAAQEMNLTN